MYNQPMQVPTGSVKDLVEEAKRNEKKMVGVYNPTNKDFSCEYGGEELKVLANDWAEFVTYKANHVKKHLVDFVMNEKGLNWNQMNIEKIQKEVEFKP